MASDPVPPTMAEIRLWNGVQCPNAAGRRALDDLPALIRDIEALRGTLVFEDEPSTFEAALRAEAEKGA